MNVDMKAMKAEIGGAFLLSWVVLNLGGMGIGSLGGALVLAVAWTAFSGAHILPVVTWSHIMTGDLGDAEGNWMANGMRLVAQMVGATLAILLASEAGGAEGLDLLPDWAAPDMFITDIVGDNLWPALGMIAGGAVWWQIHNRCDSAWMSAFAAMALVGAMSMTGAHDMGNMLMDGKTFDVNTVVNWITDGLLVGLGAFLGVQIDDLVGGEEE